MESMGKGFKVMAAMCSNRGIGYKGGLPWPKLENDYNYYLKVTSQITAPGRKTLNIRGRKTWEAAGSVSRERGDVININISRTPGKADKNVYKVVSSFEEAISLACISPLCDVIDNVWIMGGASVYEEAINHPLCKGICLTLVQGDFPSDTFMPAFEDKYHKVRNPFSDVVKFQDNGFDYELCYFARNDN